MNAPPKPFRAPTGPACHQPGGVAAWLGKITPCAGRRGVSFPAARRRIRRASGAGAMLSGLLDEGAGDLDAEAFHRRLGRSRDPAELQCRARRILRRLQTLTAMSTGLRAAGAGGQRAATDEAPIERRARPAQRSSNAIRRSRTPCGAAAACGLAGHSLLARLARRIGEIDTVTRDDLVALHRNCWRATR